MRTYKEIEYARSRLVETIVLFKGKPVTVRDIGGFGEVYVRYLSNGAEVTCQLDELDINPVPLGYINMDTHASYICRTPMRRDWRQGLRNINIRDVNGDKPRFSPTSLSRTICGDFPKLDDCIKMIDRGGVISAAFSRNFAVLHGNDLQHKGKWVVGKIGLEGYSLLKPFEWVRECLEEELAA